MHPQSRTASRPSRRAADEDLFERKSRELVAPEDEIEAWELDAQDLGDIGLPNDYLSAAGTE